MSDKVQNQISELKVTGHTMALEPGLYCVFSAPGSAAPAADSGLPIVRISAAPGSRSGLVEVVGLNTEGWIGPDAATLVRVGGTRSNVLVTVYQSKDTKADAPSLQVVRISGQGDAPAEAAAAPVAAPEPAAPPAAAQVAPAPAVTSAPADISVVAHIYGRGDVGGRVGEWVGERGSKRWIEGFGVAPVDGVPAADIEYQAVLGRGWLSPWSPGGQFCGSRSMALPILGLRVRLRGASAETHQVSVAATFIDGSSAGPVGGGEPCEAESLAALEAFRIVIERSAAVKPASAKPVGKTVAKAKPKANVAKAPIAKTPAAKPVAAKSVMTKPVVETRAVAKPAPVKAEPATAGKKAPTAKPAATKTVPSTARASRTPTPTRRR
jgi:hypothetical protein